MAGRVDDVDLGVLVDDCGVLRRDGDAALALEVHVVHHPVHDGLMGGKAVALAQQAVHQGGLAVVDVGDDGDVAEVHSGALGEGAAYSPVVGPVHRPALW